MKKIVCPYTFKTFYFFFLLAFLAFGLSSCGGSKNTHSSAKRGRSKAPAKQQQVVETARSYIGTPYKWGGTTRAGLDCSGLLVCSFREANIKLPRTSAEQSKYGKSVSLYQLQPGDLLFFAAKKGRGKITHVGMVTEVKGRDKVMFIHASSSLGVVENNLHSDYYRKIFRKAQRPF